MPQAQKDLDGFSGRLLLRLEETTESLTLIETPP
jgi:hypothetical protein